MDFETTFMSWLTAALDSPIGKEVKAFAFNLYEPSGDPNVKFGIELIGAGIFDEDDSDWACEEVWEPETGGLDIPVAYSSRHWESCLAKVKALVARLLNEDSEVATKLKAVQGIGIGFVDGDLEVVWKL